MNVCNFFLNRATETTNAMEPKSNTNESKSELLHRKDGHLKTSLHVHMKPQHGYLSIDLDECQYGKLITIAHRNLLHSKNAKT